MPGSPVTQEKMAADRPAEIPSSLQEFGEVPQGYKSVFIVVSREDLPYLSKQGLRVVDNQMAQTHPELEEILQDAATEKGSKFSRTTSVFAYPKRPEEIKYELVSRDPNEQVVIEAKVDPARALVADGMYYTDAGIDLGEGKEKEAMSWAKVYWKEAKPLDEYLNDPEGYFLNSPEVLIPEDIPVSRLRVIS